MNHNPNLTLEMFNKSLQEVWREKKQKYEFILNAGYSLKNALFHLLMIVWEEDIIQEDWNEATLLQLFKGKGDFFEPGNQRNSYIKENIPKLFTHILVSQIKEKIIENMIPFQI